MLVHYYVLFLWVVRVYCTVLIVYCTVLVVYWTVHIYGAQMHHKCHGAHGFGAVRPFLVHYTSALFLYSSSTLY